MTETRDRIAMRVKSSPGIHFNELVRELDIAPGQAQYHLRQLLRGDDIREHRLYGQTHYYPLDYDQRERILLALLRRETVRDILLYLVDNGASRPGVVASDIGIARSTLEWQLDRLTTHDIVDKRRPSRNRVTLYLTDPEEVADFLDIVEPTFPERMVDRFSRLVDNLFEE